MAGKNRKAEKHRRKRQAKKNEGRIRALRMESRMKSDACVLYACTANRYWRENGEATILVARSVGPGRVTVAAFLVDIWAMGLKDAWGRVDIPVGEFDDMRARLSRDLDSAPLDIGTARHLVFGGIELATELGFRLPRRYERWTAILGPLPDGEAPDMSLFLADGRIRLICSQRDLEARLVGSSIETFLQRPDVDLMMGSDDFTLVDEDKDGLDDTLSLLEDRMLNAAKEWCFANGQSPHPRLEDVVGAAVEAMVQNIPEGIDEDELEAIPQEAHEVVSDQIASFVRATGHDDPEGMIAATAQFEEFIRGTESPEKFMELLSLPDPP